MIVRPGHLAAGLLLAALLAGCPEQTPSAPDAPQAGDLGLPDAGAGDSVSSPDRGCVDPDGGMDGFSAVPAAVKALRASIISLDKSWRFATDAKDQGKAAGWYKVGFDDGGWTVIHAGKTWEQQGFPGYDGVAWYRKQVTVPAAWKGVPVRFEAGGVDDEYDLYVNGVLMAHHGDKAVRSVYNAKTKTRVDAKLNFGGANTIAVRVNDWGLGGGLWRRVLLKQALPMTAYEKYLPKPILDGNKAWVDLYWAAWRMAWDKVSFGTKDNGLVPAFMDEGFNEQIYQWDSSFICLFARYGRRLFPVMPTLDNFYDRQRADGYIQRVYSETDGKEVNKPTAGEPMVNPPLFSWVEWEYYRFSGDASRLARVLPVLEKYYGWLKKNLRQAAGKGLYFQTDLGSGMDNMPRGDVAGAAWIDASAQQALNARYLARIAGALGQAAKQKAWDAEHQELVKSINTLLWSDADGIYYDLTKGGAHAGVKHAGAFWTVLAGVADQARLAKLAAHLKDPKTFYRPHLFPTLAADHAKYSGKGHYWRGGVWAPTNYMIVRGLAAAGGAHLQLARAAAENHVTNMAKVYASPPTDSNKIAPEERDGDYRTIWECYSPEHLTPATRWDDKYYSRQDFVGWSGLGPVAMLLELIIGLEVDGAKGRIDWRISRTDRHGVERMPLGSRNVVSLVAAARVSEDAPVKISVTARRAFTLRVLRAGKKARSYSVCPGTGEVTVSW